MIDTAFLPTRDAALKRLHEFVPRAGRAYASNRNYDLGPQRHQHVSNLSPYIRHRLIDEVEVLRAVCERHSPSSAEKFIQEVSWRTYWKGWLERRPSVWDDYCKSVVMCTTRYANNSNYLKAMNGDTGIACYDAWVAELRDTGYLHNHARMWFASIWIFTLRLPWELGADFFLRHLLDADAASNTLSWRWVAGLQTIGKSYQARADNIAKFTQGRFQPDAHDLAPEAKPLVGDLPPTAGPSPHVPDPDKTRPSFLLAHEDDLLSDLSVLDGYDIRGIAIAHALDARGLAQTGPAPKAFTFAALQDAAERLAAKFNLEPTLIDLSHDADDWTAWCADTKDTQIIMPYVAVGSFRDALARATHHTPMTLQQIQRPWDTSAWSHATKGFFPFKKSISNLLSAHVFGQGALFEDA